MGSGRNGDFSSPTWRHPTQAAQKMAPAATPRPGLAREGDPSAEARLSLCPPRRARCPLAEAARQSPPGAGPRGRSLRRRRQQAGGWAGKLGRRPGGAWSRIGRGRQPRRACCVHRGPLCPLLGVPARLVVRGPWRSGRVTSPTPPPPPQATREKKIFVAEITRPQA